MVILSNSIIQFQKFQVIRK